jgi:hypothetical protein
LKSKSELQLKVEIGNLRLVFIIIGLFLQRLMVRLDIFEETGILLCFGIPAETPVHSIVYQPLPARFVGKTDQGILQSLLK